MIFLPNKFELYTCALRNTMQFLIIKNGYKAKYLKNLMKIHKAEALFTTDAEPLDVKDFSLEILKAVFLKSLENGKAFRFKTENTGVFLINKKLYTSLLLSLCRDAEKIEVGLYKEKLLVSAYRSDNNEITKLLKALNAVSFFERKTETLSVLITASKTDKKPKDSEKDWEYILNPLSVVNIYFNS